MRYGSFRSLQKQNSRHAEVTITVTHSLKDVFFANRTRAISFEGWEFTTNPPIGVL